MVTVAELRAIITADDAEYQQRMAGVLSSLQSASQAATDVLKLMARSSAAHLPAEIDEAIDRAYQGNGRNCQRDESKS